MNLFNIMENYSITLVFNLVVVFTLYRTTIQDSKYEKRYEDKSFPNHTLVYNKIVSCGKHKVGLYPAQTWTCADIRVDGLRLAYGLYPGLGVDNKCTETKGFDDVTELCLVMMGSIDVKKPLWAALVTNATCDYLDESRMLLNQTLQEEKTDRNDVTMSNKTQVQKGRKRNPLSRHSSIDKEKHNITFTWNMMGPGHGWVHTIQCMAVRGKTQNSRLPRSSSVDHTEL